MIERVHFEGIKSLQDVTVDLERFTVLVGPNGSGKSSLLDEIEFVANAGASGETGGSDLGSIGRKLNQRNPLDRATRGKTQTDLVWAARAPGNRELEIRVPLIRGGIYWQGATVRACVGNNCVDLPKRSDNAVREFEETLEDDFHWGAQRLALAPSLIARPSRVDLNRLEASGHGLPTKLKDLAAADTAAFLDLQHDMRAVVPSFRQLAFGKGKDGNSDVTELDLVMQQGRVPASAVSDGTLIALTILTCAHDKSVPNLILMDDIDHGLHLSAQLEMLRALRAVMTARADLQLICTTHSPYMLHDVSVEEVRVMALDSEGRSLVRPLAAHPDVDRWRATMTAGELWANLGEDWVRG